MQTITHSDDYTLTTDERRLDVEAIQAFLTRSYWPPGARDHRKCDASLNPEVLSPPAPASSRNGM